MDELVLSYKENEIKLFCYLFSLNCIFTGILWFFYLYCDRLCRGKSFKQLVFFVDTLFDTFYALLPIIVITNRSEFDIKLAMAVLQTTNVLSFCVTFFFCCCFVVAFLLRATCLIFAQLYNHIGPHFLPPLLQCPI